MKMMSCSRRRLLTCALEMQERGLLKASWMWLPAMRSSTNRYLSVNPGRCVVLFLSRDELVLLLAASLLARFEPNEGYWTSILESAEVLRRFGIPIPNHGELAHLISEREEAIKNLFELLIQDI